MKPAVKNFTFRRGDTPPRLAFRLVSRNVRSDALKVRPAGADVVEWTIYWPTGGATKTSTMGGGLKVDPRTRLTEYPLSSTDLARIPNGAPVPYAIRVVNGDGFRRTYVTGTLSTEGGQP